MPFPNPPGLTHSAGQRPSSAATPTQHGSLGCAFCPALAQWSSLCSPTAARRPPRAARPPVSRPKTRRRFAPQRNALARSSNCRVSMLNLLLRYEGLSVQEHLMGVTIPTRTAMPPPWCYSSVILLTSGGDGPTLYQPLYTCPFRCQYAVRDNVSYPQDGASGRRVCGHAPIIRQETGTPNGVPSVSVPSWSRAWSLGGPDGCWERSVRIVRPATSLGQAPIETVVQPCLAHTLAAPTDTVEFRAEHLTLPVRVKALILARRPRRSELAVARWRLPRWRLPAATGFAASNATSAAPAPGSPRVVGEEHTGRSASLQRRCADQRGEASGGAGCGYRSLIRL